MEDYKKDIRIAGTEILIHECDYIKIIYKT